MVGAFPDLDIDAEFGPRRCNTILFHHPYIERSPYPFFKHGNATPFSSHQWRVSRPPPRVEYPVRLEEGSWRNFLTQGFHSTDHNVWNMERIIKAGVLGEIGVIIVMQCVGLFVSLAEEEEFLLWDWWRWVEMKVGFWIRDFHAFETEVQMIMDLIGQGGYAFRKLNKPTKVGLSGRGFGRLSKRSRVRDLVYAKNFLGRGPRFGARQYLEGLVLDNV
ncbi:hypothetical protein SO802_032313 [Lithocarpus litseifolius]|uniref:Uncharacterized protein n=1 Tax=Lithocarpus litseifolius TaxID=425828 RepID=A0AAW2BQC8_9ROSI